MGNWIFIILLTIFIVGKIPKKPQVATVEDRLEREKVWLLENAVLAEKKYRYESKSMPVRIAEIIHKYFPDAKIMENIAMLTPENEAIVFPILAITEKGILFVQTADYPGKILYGNPNDDVWKTAASDRCYQEVENAIIESVNKGMALKAKTSLDTKPVVVLSKYTPAARNILDDEKVFEEEKAFESEVKYMANYSKTIYPPEFIRQAFDMLVKMDADARNTT